MAKGSVTERISAYIRENIASGVWPVGSKIPSENELCQLLGVSRMSVRSALQQFIILGVLQSHHGQGTFVLSDDLRAFSDRGAPSPQVSACELLQLVQARLIVEPALCALCAAAPSRELLAELHCHLGEMKARLGSTHEFVAADAAFHLAICRAAGNVYLEQFMQNALHGHGKSLEQVNHVSGYYGGLYYHTLILEALEKRDEKRARKLMTEHLQRNIEELEENMQRDEPQRNKA